MVIDKLIGQGLLEGDWLLGTKVQNTAAGDYS